MKNIKTKLALLLSLILLLPSSLFSPTKALAYDQSGAETYLLAHANNPWSTMALQVLGAPSIPTDYLKTISGTSAIEYEAPILAITATGNDPRTFGSTDYIAALESYHTQNQLGDPNALNDDVFGMLALISAGVNDNVVSDSKSFILANQNANGGWPFTLSSASDSNITAAAITALIADGVPASDSHITSALAYLKTAQNSDGGFAETVGNPSDSDSTSWAIWALDAAGISPASWSVSGHSPIDFLSANQTASGYFAPTQSNTTETSFSPISTAYAAIALAGKTLPVASVSQQSQNQLFPFRIEGSQSQICAGNTEGPTAMDIIKNAAAQCGYTYNIESSSYGPYLNSINSDVTPADFSTGWLYVVDGVQPSVGAADYQLKTGDDVLWYFGSYQWLPTKIVLSSASVASGQSATATVDYDDGTGWKPLGGATVYVGATTVTTAADGTAAISGPDGYYKIYASENGYVRSNQALLQIGSPQSGSVSLNANVPQGEVAGTSTIGSVISFTVTPSSVDFGDIGPGSSVSKSLQLNNNGSVGITVQSIVTGDGAFTDNLSLDNKNWNQFSDSINPKGSDNVTAALNIPANYPLTAGQKSGTLTLWATSQ